MNPAPPVTTVLTLTAPPYLTTRCGPAAVPRRPLRAQTPRASAHRGYRAPRGFPAAPPAPPGNPPSQFFNFFLFSPPAAKRRTLAAEDRALPPLYPKQSRQS